MSFPYMLKMMKTEEHDCGQTIFDPNYTKPQMLAMGCLFHGFLKSFKNILFIVLKYLQYRQDSEP